MICHNCGQETSRRGQVDRLTWQFRAAIPPIRRVIVQEMWCMKCRSRGPLFSNTPTSEDRRKRPIIDRTDGDD